MDSFRATASLETLRKRAELLDRLRGFFKARDFLEVETPVIGHQVIVDRYLEPIATEPLGSGSHRATPQGSELSRGWLQTSPELAMKRLLASGAESIFQVGKAFRRDEMGPLHNLEFTMVEWYRVGDDQSAGIGLLCELYEALVPGPVVQRISYGDAFRSNTGLNPHTATPDALREYCQAHSIAAPDGLDRDGWLNLILATAVEPNLGVDAPTILFDYPASQAALAVTRECEGHEVAERFELYANGIELANGYHELLDAPTLAARQRFENTARVHLGKPKLPEPSLLIDAMRSGLPACSGVALGFDRLAMVALGAKSISEVIAFPFDRC